MTRKLFTIFAATALFSSLSFGQLLVDFNSTSQDNGPHNDTAGGFAAYDFAHEGGTGTDPWPTVSYPAFGTNVSVTPNWPDTTDPRVEQMIDRTAAFDGNWMDASTDLASVPFPTLGLDLVTDFIGIDTRANSGGNGDWDGTTGTPTSLTLTLSGLPAGSYSWTSAHIDTEHVHTDFGVKVSTDAGTSFTALPNGRMVDASDGGNPNSIDSGFQSALAQDSATAFIEGGVYSAGFTSDGSDVVIEFTPFSQDAVHRQIFGINGFVVQQVPEPASFSLIVFAMLGLVGIARRR
jgi:hypothetical protein